MAIARHAVVLRRSPGTDVLDASSIDVTLAVRHIVAVPTIVGAGSMAPNGHLFGRSGKRYRFDIDCVGFRRNGDDGFDRQSFGRYLRLVNEILTGDADSRLWIWRAFEAGTDTDTPLARDSYDDETPATEAPTTGNLWHLSDVIYQAVDEDYDYDPPGLLPIEVVCLDQVEATHEGAGFYSCSFTLWAAHTH